jgi:DNA polymerase-3 subunit delta
MKQLKSDLKSGVFKRSYLFYGEEKYLSQFYEGQMQDKVLASSDKAMNLDIFDGKSGIAQIIDACETLPFLSDSRLVIAKDTKLFSLGKKENESKQSSKKDDVDMMLSFLDEVPETNVLLFVEDEVDKRSRMFKKISEAGRAVEFKTPPEKELSDWIVNMLRKRGKEISPSNAQILLRQTARSMDSLASEIGKLASYASDRASITIDDINAVCIPSLESRVFDLVDAVGGKKLEIALDVFSNMVLMKESPFAVLAMISRQFRLMAQSKALQERGLGANEIAGALSLRGFVAAECLRQCRNFTKEQLVDALSDCLKADIGIKTGKMNEKLAVETLIVKYAGV